MDVCALVRYSDYYPGWRELHTAHSLFPPADLVFVTSVVVSVPTVYVTACKLVQA